MQQIEIHYYASKDTILYLPFEYSHTQDTKSGKGVGHRPEGGHDHQAEYDVLVMHAEGT
jgi:hypothetical protein